MSYFLWYERDGTEHRVDNPSRDHCYPMFEGAIRGYNGTAVRIHLYGHTDCTGDPPSYVDPGKGWDNRSTGGVLWGFG